MTVARAGFAQQQSRPEVQKYVTRRDATMNTDRGLLESLMLPDRFSSCILPPFPSLMTGECVAGASTQVTTYFDLYPTINALASPPEYSVPTAFSPNGVLTPLYGSNFTYIHTNDPLCPMVFGYLPNNTNVTTSGRQWNYALSSSFQSEVRAFSWTGYPPDQMAADQYPLPLTGHGTATNSVFPTGFDLRPLSASTDPVDNRVYVWIDSSADSVVDGNPGSQGVSQAVLYVNAGSYGRFQGNITGGLSGFNLCLSVTRAAPEDNIVSDDTHQSSVLVYCSATFDSTNNESLITVTTTTPVKVLISSSGWYSFRWSLGLPGLISWNPSWSFTTIEYNLVATTFWLNGNLLGQDSLVTKYYVTGAGLLASFRTPVLTTAGTATAYRPLSTSSSDLVSALTQSNGAPPTSTKPSELANGGAGFPLEKGLWSWTKPHFWPRDYVVAAFNDAQNGSTPFLPRLVGSVQFPLSFEVCFLTPSFQTTTVSVAPRVEFRFTAFTNLIYVPGTQLVLGSFPKCTKTDDFNALLGLLSVVPQFSENDWHKFFKGVADYTARAGSVLAKWGPLAYKTLMMGSRVAGAAAVMLA